MYIFLLSLFSSAQACTYQLNQVAVHMGDRSINFGDYLNQKLQAKGYTQAEDGSSPEWVVDLTLKTYQQTHFEHAQAMVSLINTSGESVYLKSADTRCYTQSCAAKDGAKVIQKSIDDFGTNLPACSL